MAHLVLSAKESAQGIEIYCGMNTVRSRLTREKIYHESGIHLFWLPHGLKSRDPMLAIQAMLIRKLRLSNDVFAELNNKILQVCVKFLNAVSHNDPLARH